MPPLETPKHSQVYLAQSLVGPLLISSGSWCAPGFVCSHQESLFLPSCGSSVIKSTSFQSQITWGFLVPLWNPQVGKSVVGPRHSWVQELLWYNYSQVCGLPTEHLYDGANGDLLQENLGHIMPPRTAAASAPIPDAGHCWSIHLQKTLKHSQTGLSQSLMGVSAPFLGPGVHKVLSLPSESLANMTFDF